jgi:hypothetical protein
LISITLEGLTGWLLPPARIALCTRLDGCPCQTRASVLMRIKNFEECDWTVGVSL